MPGRSITPASGTARIVPSFFWTVTPGKVADVLVTAGEIIEQRAFAAVWLPTRGEMQLHASLTSGVTVILAASSARSVSS